MHGKDRKVKKQWKVENIKKKKKPEILELKNTVTELNNSIESFKSKLDIQKKKAVTWRIRHLKLSSQKAKQEINK